MAKLSARGRTELKRLVLAHDVQGNDLVDWERCVIAIMSDKSVLRKRDVRFRSDGRKHSYGWTVMAKMKADTTVDQVVASFVKRGYVVDPD